MLHKSRYNKFKFHSTLTLYNIYDNIMPPNLLPPRMDQVYVTWYINWARLLVLGLVPFSAISFLNTKIYVAIRSVFPRYTLELKRTIGKVFIITENAPMTFTLASQIYIY